MKLILLLLVVLCALGLFEMARHVYHRRRIPIRIHVNGSRGKSSVTRLIAAGLRAGGVRTMAKTTGSAARLIHPDGSETAVRRRGGPNIREQLSVFRVAVSAGTEALVLECMAIRPDLQQVCEHRIVQATLGIITNVRPDHLEVMGPRLENVAASLAGTVPRNTQLLTTELDYADFLAARARHQGSGFAQVGADDVSDEVLAAFPYVEFPENVSLALAACAAAGVPREKALAGMQQVEPDPGALRIWRYQREEREMAFVNAFAANDPVSYLLIWKRLALPEKSDSSILLINLRADRHRRSKDLVPLLAREIQAQHVFLIGDGTGVFGDMLRRAGVAPATVSDLGMAPPQRIWAQLWDKCQPRGTVVGIGNIGGAARELLDFLDFEWRQA